MPVLNINSQLKAALRSSAHPLKPVVLIGDKGLSDAVLIEIDRNLEAHGLIKVRAGGESREVRDTLLQTICDKLNCAPVHHLGKIFILYRPTGGDADGLAFITAARKKTIDPLFKPARKASEPHIPKKLAAAGKDKVVAKRRSAKETDEQFSGTMSPRERYLGIDEKTKRPSLHGEQRNLRGEARVSAARPSRPTGGLAQRTTASPKPAARPRRAGSALSLRAGARRNVKAN